MPVCAIDLLETIEVSSRLNNRTILVPRRGTLNRSTLQLALLSHPQTTCPFASSTSTEVPPPSLLCTEQQLGHLKSASYHPTMRLQCITLPCTSLRLWSLANGWLIRYGQRSSCSQEEHTFFNYLLLLLDKDLVWLDFFKLTTTYNFVVMKRDTNLGEFLNKHTASLSEHTFSSSD